VFTTVEEADLTYCVVFKKSKAHVEPFSRLKLFISVYQACGHLKDAHKVAEALTTTIISKALPKASSAIMDRDVLISVATEVLKHYDKAAATYYHAYHPSKK